MKTETALKILKILKTRYNCLDIQAWIAIEGTTYRTWCSFDNPPTFSCQEVGGGKDLILNESKLSSHPFCCWEYRHVSSGATLVTTDNLTELLGQMRSLKSMFWENCMRAVSAELEVQHNIQCDSIEKVRDSLKSLKLIHSNLNVPIYLVVDLYDKTHYVTWDNDSEVYEVLSSPDLSLQDTYTCNAFPNSAIFKKWEYADEQEPRIRFAGETLQELHKTISHWSTKANNHFNEVKRLLSKDAYGGTKNENT